MKSNRRRGFTLMELMIVVAIIFVILSVATINYTNARVHANEAMVIRMIGTIHTAQAQYQSQTGKFAVALAELQRLIPAKLAGGKHSGYSFVLEGTEDGYIVIAVPESSGVKDARTFLSDQTLVIRDAKNNSTI